MRPEPDILVSTRIARRRAFRRPHPEIRTDGQVPDDARPDPDLDARGRAVHRRQRGGGAVQLLRDEDDSRRLHDPVPRVERRRTRVPLGQRGPRGDGLVRRECVLLPRDRRPHRGRVAREVPHDHDPLVGLRPRPRVSGDDGPSLGGAGGDLRTEAMAADRTLPDRGRLGRHQAVRLRPRRRPVRTREQASAFAGVRLVLLLDQLRLVLLDAAHAVPPQERRSRLGVRHPRRPHVPRDDRLLDGPPQVRPHPAARLGVRATGVHRRRSRRHPEARAGLHLHRGLLVALRPDRQRLGAAGRQDGSELPRNRLAGEPGAGDQPAPDPRLHPAFHLPRLPRDQQGLPAHADPKDLDRSLRDGGRLRDLRNHRELDRAGHDPEHRVAAPRLRRHHGGGGHGLDHRARVQLHAGPAADEVVRHEPVPHDRFARQRLHRDGQPRDP